VRQARSLPHLVERFLLRREAGERLRRVHQRLACLDIVAGRCAPPCPGVTFKTK
jgi:hypothetical protein